MHRLPCKMLAFLKLVVGLTWSLCYSKCQLKACSGQSLCVCVCMLRKRWRRLRLLETQTSEVREEVSSSVSWIFKASGVASKAFFFLGVGWVCFNFCLGEGRNWLVTSRGKWEGKLLLVLAFKWTTGQWLIPARIVISCNRKRTTGDTCWRRHLQAWNWRSWKNNGVITQLNCDSPGKWAEVQL